MTDRFAYYDTVRQKIIDALKVDLIGPQSEDEILDENPRHAYVIRMLSPQVDDDDEVWQAKTMNRKWIRTSHMRMARIIQPEKMTIMNPITSTRFRLPSL